MVVYYILLLLMLGLAYPLCIRNPSKPKKLLYLFITFGYMWFLATFRYGIGFDYFSYINIFNTQSSASFALPVLEDLELPGQGPALVEWWRAFSSKWGFWITGGNKYPGFTLLNKFLSLFLSNPTVLYGVYELLILVPVVWFIYRYCKEVWLSTWLFVTLTFFYTSMNFIRQSLATSILLLGYSFLKNRKPVPFLLIALLATSIHLPAIIIIPVYFLCNLRLTPKLGIAYGLVTLVLFCASSPIVNFVVEHIPVYAGYKDSIYIVNGFPLVFLIVPILLFGACLALKPVWEKRVPESTILLNLMMYNALIWLFITKHFILERFSMYVYIFVLLAVPSALSSLKASPEDREKLAELLSEEASHSKKGQKPGKEFQAKVRALKQKVGDHEKYYWSAVAAVMFITFLYNDFGANVNRFHGVFPYYSSLEWFNNLFGLVYVPPA